MCNGILKYTGQPLQSITLTKTTDAQRKINRDIMCPGGFCAKGLANYTKRFYPDGLTPEAERAILAAKAMSCDEFPFARTVEGGNLEHGSRICLPISENNWQGGVMGNYFKGGTIKVDEKFVVRIVGWNCATQAPDADLLKRTDEEQSMEVIGGGLPCSPSSEYATLISDSS